MHVFTVKLMGINEVSSYELLMLLVIKFRLREKGTCTCRRNDHGVPKEHIQRMKERYQRDLTVEMILGVPLKKSKM